MEQNKGMRASAFNNLKIRTTLKLRSPILSCAVYLGQQRADVRFYHRNPITI